MLESTAQHGLVVRAVEEGRDVSNAASAQPGGSGDVSWAQRPRTWDVRLSFPPHGVAQMPAETFGASPQHAGSGIVDFELP